MYVVGTTPTKQVLKDASCNFLIDFLDDDKIISNIKQSISNNISMIEKIGSIVSQVANVRRNRFNL